MRVLLANPRLPSRQSIADILLTVTASCNGRFSLCFPPVLAGGEKFAILLPEAAVMQVALQQVQAAGLHLSICCDSSACQVVRHPDKILHRQVFRPQARIDAQCLEIG